MLYSKAYIDKLLNNVQEYHSKVELLGIAIEKKDECPMVNHDWITEVSEIMNWQAMSDRSGVWTYYEILNESEAQTVIKRLNNQNNGILDKYVMGIGRYKDEGIMDEIDKWIQSNERLIYKHIEDAFASNKEWFYE